MGYEGGEDAVRRYVRTLPGASTVFEEADGQFRDGIRAAGARRLGLHRANRMFASDNKPNKAEGFPFAG